MRLGRLYKAEGWEHLCIGTDYGKSMKKGGNIYKNNYKEQKIPRSICAPLSMGFSRQEYWSGLPVPSPGDLPNPETELRSPALQENSLPSERILYLLYQGRPRILERVAYPFSRRSSQPRSWTRVSCITGEFFTRWTSREAHSLLATLAVIAILRCSIYPSRDYLCYNCHLYLSVCVVRVVTLRK